MTPHHCSRCIIVLFLLAGAGASTDQRGVAQSLDASDLERPNVLWIVAEDMGPELGAYRAIGNELAAGVRTPNLDRLAREGMLYTHAFTTSPVCSPSRSAFNTGMYQTTIGAHQHRSHRPDDPSPYPFPLPDSVRLVSDWLRHAGYVTGNITRFPDSLALEGSGKTDWNFSYDGAPFDTERWSGLTAHQPFYGQVNFSETHRGGAWQAAQASVAEPADPSEVTLPPYYPDHPVVRREWAEYLNTVMALDRKVGTVLDLLDAAGLADNTVVMFFADHGRAMVRGKQWPYDSGLRVPLIVRWPEGHAPPDGYAAGTTSDRLISAIDLAATTLAVAGVPRPEAMQGRVFLGADADPPRQYVFGGRDRGDETVDRMRTVRTRRFRYIRNDYPERPYMQRNRYKEATYPTVWVLRTLHAEGALTPAQASFMQETRPREELYDLKKDPYETVNRADSSAYRAITRQLRVELDRWIRRTNDQGRTPEDPDVAAYYEQRMKRLYGDRIDELRAKWGVQ